MNDKPSTLVKEGREYESRLFGGAYSYSRVTGPRAMKGSPAYRMALAGRERYNSIRRELGMREVTDWTKRPDDLIEAILNNQF